MKTLITSILIFTITNCHSGSFMISNGWAFQGHQWEGSPKLSYELSIKYAFKVSSNFDCILYGYNYNFIKHKESASTYTTNYDLNSFYFGVSSRANKALSGRLLIGFMSVNDVWQRTETGTTQFKGDIDLRYMIGATYSKQLSDHIRAGISLDLSPSEEGYSMFTPSLTFIYSTKKIKS